MNSPYCREINVLLYNGSEKRGLDRSRVIAQVPQVSQGGDAHFIGDGLGTEAWGPRLELFLTLPCPQ